MAALKSTGRVPYNKERVRVAVADEIRITGSRRVARGPVRTAPGPSAVQ